MFLCPRLQKTSVSLWWTVILLWLLQFSSWASTTPDRLASTILSGTVEGVQPTESTSRGSHKRSSSLAVNRVFGSTFRRDLLQRSAPSETKDGGACNLTEWQQKRLYTSSSQTWNITDVALEELDSDVQSIIACAGPGDTILFSTTRPIQPPRSIIISTSVTLNSQAAGPLIRNGITEEVEKKARLHCPSRSDLLVIRSGSPLFTNLIFEDCNGTGNVVSIDTNCDENSSQDMVYFRHVEFRNLALSGDHRVLEAARSRCARLVMENVVLKDNICGRQGCMSLTLNNTLRDVLMTRNQEKETTIAVISPSILVFPTGSETVAINVAALENELRLFIVVNSTFTLRKSAIERNRISGMNQGRATLISGIAILSSYSTLNIQDSVFVNNSGWDGGAIHALTSSLDVNNCTFRENNAGTGDGGAIHATNATSATITSCTFSKNGAVNGAGVFAHASSFFHLLNSNFSENNGTRGAGLYVRHGDLSIVSCNFSQNHASSIGSGLTAKALNGSIEDSTFLANNAAKGGACSFQTRSTIRMKGVHFVRNLADEGGAILATNTTLDIQNASFNRNWVNNIGSAIYLREGVLAFIDVNITDNKSDGQGTLYVRYSRAILRTVVVRSNLARFGGGGFRSHHSNIHVIYSIFERNFAESYGSVLHSSHSNVNVSHSRFQRNSADGDGGVLFSSYSDIRLSHSRFENNSAADYGGALCFFHSSVKMSHSWFENNYARREGGVLASSFSSVRLSLSTFENNYADGSGGVLYSSYSKARLRHSRFENNSATQDGGVLASSHSNVSVSHSRFENNSATQDGGVLPSSHSNVSVSHSRFENNSATRFGGVLNPINSTVSVSHSKFERNTAGIHGGVLTSSNSIVRVTYSRFERNSATQEGGVMYSGRDSNISVSHSRFKRNSATQEGGVLSSLISNISMTLSKFERNSAGWDGGVVSFSLSTARLSHSTFERNFASQKGGVLDSYASTVTVSHSRFVNNSAGWDGGVLSLSLSTAGLSHSTFERNLASQKGGVLPSDDSNISVNPLRFERNSAGCNGGGINADHSDVALTRTNFTSNVADEGGGCYLGESNAIMEHVLFSKNQAIDGSGGGVYINNGTLNGDLSIFQDNNASKWGGGIYGENLEPTSLVGVRFHHNNGMAGGGGYFSNVSATMQSVSISRNRAIDGSGGGICATNSSRLKGTNISLHSNVAFADGGGIRIEDNSSFLCTHCEFKNNEARRGGGMCVWNNDSIFVVAQLHDSVFVHNRAQSYGGGLHFSRPRDIGINCSASNITCGHLILLNTEFVNNSAIFSGSAILTTDPDGVLVSCNRTKSHYGFMDSNQLASLNPVHPKALCPSWSGNQLPSNAPGDAVGTYGRGFSFYVGPDSETWMSGDEKSGFVLENVTSGRPLPVIYVRVMDAYKNGPMPTLPRRVEVQITSTRGFVQGTLTTIVDGGSGNFSNVVGSAKPGSYTLRISSSSVMLQKTQIIVHVRACLVGEESTATRDSCQRCDTASYNFEPEKVGGCTPCPDGATCDNRFIIPRDGYWHKSPCHSNVMECLIEEACAYGERQSDLTSFFFNILNCSFDENILMNYIGALCREGYEGPLCGSCADSHGLWLGSYCSKCPPAYGSVLTLLLITLYLLVVASFTIRGGLPLDPKTPQTTTTTTNASSQTLERTSSTQQSVSLEMAEIMLQGQMSSTSIQASLIPVRSSTTTLNTTDDLELTRWIASEIFKVTINFLQVTAIAATINVQWTDGMLTMFETSEYLGAMTMAALSMPIDCIVSSNSANARSISRTLLSLLVPGVVMSIFVAVWGFITKRERKGKSYFWKRVTLSVIAVVYISYLGLTRLGVRVFYCVDVYDSDDAFSSSRTKYWAVDTAIRCYKNAHLGLIVIAVFVLVVVSLAFPLVSAIYLSTKKVQHDQTDTWTFETMGFLYRAFKEKFVFWESVVMFRKACLSVIVVFSYPLGGQSQGLLALGVLLLCLYLQQTCSPYRKEFHRLNYYESGSLLVSCFTFMFGQYFTVDDASYSARRAVEVSIITVNATFFMFLLVAFFKSGLDHMRVALRLKGLPIDDSTSWLRILKLVIKSKKSTSTLSTN